jgi:hypothetical protein
VKKKEVNEFHFSRCISDSSSREFLGILRSGKQEWTRPKAKPSDYANYIETMMDVLHIIGMDATTLSEWVLRIDSLGELHETQ